MSFTYDDFLWINFNKNLSMDNFKTGRSCQDSLEALIYEISELETSIINDPNLIGMHQMQLLLLFKHI